MTEDQIIDGILEREGNAYVEHPNDKGGPTRYGITAKTLGAWRGYGRHATRAEVKALTVEEARRIYVSLFITGPLLVPENIPFERLRVALIDEGVHAGPTVAIRHLQHALGVTEDGVIGPITRAAIRSHASGDALVLTCVRLRCLRYARIVEHDPSQRIFLAGWISRSFEMLA